LGRGADRLARRGEKVGKNLDPAAIKVFRSYYPKGNNYLICPLSIPGYSKRVAGLDIYVCNPDGWGQRMGSSRSRKKGIDQE